MTQTTRRGAFALAAATGLAATPAAAQPAAATAQLRTQAPAWHRFRWGEFEATVVSDGHLPLGRPAEGFLGAEQRQLEQALERAFLPADNIVLEQNALVLNTGRALILFDTGMGDSMGAASQMFGPTTGRLLANLRAAGIEPAQITHVVLTHAHCDHCWALVDARGNRNFPNAQVVVSEADLRFWTDDANKRGPAFMEVFVEGAKRNLHAYRDRMVMARNEQPVVPGVTAVATPGHTVGHMVYAITSGGRTVVNTGDLAHHHILLLRTPLLQFAFDTDPAQSAQTRRRMLDRLATDGHSVLSYHFPWPGLGRLSREGEGFAWHPAPMNVTTTG